MRVVLTDFTGQKWYVESEQHISVKACPNCGCPLGVKLLLIEATPATHVIFRNSEDQILGTFDTESFSEIPKRCEFCGYTEMKK